jgi:hypothetical protein
MPKKQNPLSVLVTGDVTIDWNIAHQSHKLCEPTDWTGEATGNMNCQFGSAALLADLITAMTKLPKNLHSPVKITRPDTPKLSSVSRYDPRYTHSYALWTEYCDKEPGKDPRWRVERFLGLDRPTGARKHKAKAALTNPAKADIIVIDDSNLGFRGNPEKWPKAISNPDPGHTPWVIVKMSTPVADGDLWKHLVSAFPKRLVAVLTIDDLRQSEIQVSARISWEKTAEELHWELTHNPKVNGLTNAACTIISFGPSGALIIPGHKNIVETPKILFDPLFMEGEWAPGKGMIIGKTSTLVAGIIHQILLKCDKPDFVAGIQSGVTAMRHLQTIGYDKGKGFEPRLRFPANAVGASLKSAEKSLSIAELPPRKGNNPSEQSLWTILSESYHNSLEALSEQIVQKGTKNTLNNVPIGKFGKLVTVDRQEIESLRSIQSLIGEYCTQKKERPLSIAVFGPPGSGKSFAVEQIAIVANPDKIAEKTLTFNLSQFNSPDELIDAFHQIRDIGLSGKIPLVFWDEFDTTLDGNKLGWLRFFLAPMQDGKFQQGQITHPIGKAIFVFAGGTFPNADSFMNLLSEKVLTEDLAKKLADEKASSPEKETEAAEKLAKKLIKKISDAKVPDFISRLKGFLNVLGPNPQGENKQKDPFYIVRRALLLRSIFDRETPQLLDKDDQLRIDTGILRTFLQIDKYLHGARSMESIVAMSRLENRSHFSRSNLPPEKQLRLHVDPIKFIELLHQLKLEGDLLETLAKLNHDFFCQSQRDKGYVWGEITDDEADPKTHSSLVDYDDLSSHEKEQNRSAVRDIPTKLNAFGYAMVPRRNNEADFVFPPDILDAMATREHERWMEEKQEDKWEYAPETNKKQKRHALLVEWDKLPDKEKEKDRQIIAIMSTLLAKAGYTIVKLSH